MLDILVKLVINSVASEVYLKTTRTERTIAKEVIDKLTKR